MPNTNKKLRTIMTSAKKISQVVEVPNKATNQKLRSSSETKNNVPKKQ